MTDIFRVGIKENVLHGRQTGATGEHVVGNRRFAAMCSAMMFSSDLSEGPFRNFAGPQSRSRTTGGLGGACIPSFGDAKTRVDHSHFPEPAGRVHIDTGDRFAEAFPMFVIAITALVATGHRLVAHRPPPPPALPPPRHHRVIGRVAVPAKSERQQHEGQTKGGTRNQNWRSRIGHEGNRIGELICRKSEKALKWNGRKGVGFSWAPPLICYLVSPAEFLNAFPRPFLFHVTVDPFLSRRRKLP